MRPLPKGRSEVDDILESYRLGDMLRSVAKTRLVMTGVYGEYDAEAELKTQDQASEKQ